MQGIDKNKAQAQTSSNKHKTKSSTNESRENTCLSNQYIVEYIIEYIIKYTYSRKQYILAGYRLNKAHTNQAHTSRERERESS